MPRLLAEEVRTSRQSDRFARGVGALLAASMLVVRRCLMLVVASGGRVVLSRWTAVRSAREPRPGAGVPNPTWHLGLGLASR